MQDLRGKVAVITGAGSGIGRATTLALAAAGASVVVADIDEHAGHETVAVVTKAGGTAASVRTDVTSWDDIEGMVAFAEERFGGIDILHNNAGINAGWPRFPSASRERWDRTVAINLWAVIAGTQAALPAMRRRGAGVIINSASLAGLVTYGADPIYAATKSAVVAFTRSLAFLKDEDNVRVNCICPGFVDTPLPRRRLNDMPPEERERWAEALDKMPMLHPAEVADAVLELVLDESLAGQAMTIIFGKGRRLVPEPTL